MPEPPERLYVIGDPSALKEGLAVVGARKATPYGLNATKMLAGRAAELGVVVISGGARGCDAAAHEAALAAGGQTVAFLGGGCDEPYPKSNVELFRRIVKAAERLLRSFRGIIRRSLSCFANAIALSRGWRARRLSWRRGFPAVHSLRPTRPLPPIKTCLRCQVDFFRHIGGLEYVACAGSYAHREQGSVRFGDYVVVSGIVGGGYGAEQLALFAGDGPMRGSTIPFSRRLRQTLCVSKRLLPYSLMATIPWPRRRALWHMCRCSKGRARSLVFPMAGSALLDSLRAFMNCHAGVLSSLHG